MGKINSIYWTDRQLNFKIVKRTDYAYDKPFYEKDFKVEETTKFYSYQDGSLIIYDSNRKEIKTEDKGESEKEIKEFFTDLTKDIEIVK